MSHTEAPYPRQQQSLVVFAKHKERVSSFYAAALELEVVESEPSHDLLQGHGHEVVVHRIPPRHAAAIDIESPPRPREETPFKPAFVVTSLARVRAAAEATGGHLQPAEGAWHFRGCTVLDGWDPEGNVVQFKQRDA